MSGFTRMKRVTDPLDDKVKARIVGYEPGYVSSGSEHSVQADDDVISSSLEDIFFGFSIDDAGESSPGENEQDSDRDLLMYDGYDVNGDVLKRIVGDCRDAFRNALLAHVLKAVEVFAFVKSSKQMMRRNVMAVLRQYGYNAAICKTKWESSGGLTAGNYEVIDVVRSDSVRYFIDLDFVSEFVIARPTVQYEHLLQLLPRVFVGRCEDLKQILRVMSDAAKRSLKSRDLTLPPWRKNRYMQNKWLGPYRRTTNIFPAAFSSPVPKQSPAIKCRAIGFAGDQSFVPPTTRTR